MLKMLVVDDDKFEREGVRFLVGKFKLELELAEADSAESALKYLETNPVDIVLSDIRMPGMDGLELADRIRQAGWPVKIIFMSAYGEFEYAQRAIDVRAIRYMLKPIQVTDALKVLSQAAQQCEEERQEREQLERMEMAYERESRKEKTRLLADLLSGRLQPDEYAGMRLSEFGYAPSLRLLMLDAPSRFFDRTPSDFEKRLDAVVGRWREWIHLNEFQALLFAEAQPGEAAEPFVSIARTLTERLRSDYGQDVAVVVSGPVETIDQLIREYQTMETSLEGKFFWSEGTVVLTNRTSPDEVTTAVQEMLDEVKRHIERTRFDFASLRFEQLFDQLQNSDRLSSIYVKYVCMEVVKALFDASARKNFDLFNKHLESVNKTTRLTDLRLVMRAVLEEHSPPSASRLGEGSSKAIEEVVSWIEREYDQDLSLERLAERVYLSPSYLSYLFKKQKGISLNKYMTLHRMNKAKELLLTTNVKVVDIAPRVGYANVPYFISLFKSHFGKTPAQFREES
ncbi:response regulator transcription factor [Cohnella hongkongensis]|uniref:Response regulator n=1 Tax=Cohnella hongkongensis TaxID=178337 RepID=A0ABV9FL66_9BACL